MNRNTLLLFILLMVAIGLQLGLILHTINQQPLEVRSYYAKGSVGTFMGVAVDDQVMDFGVVREGMYSQKTVILKNPYDYPILVKVAVEGTIQPHLYFPEHTKLIPGEELAYKVTFLPVNATLGDYNGTVTIALHKV